MPTSSRPAQLLLERNQDGSEALPLGVVAGGNDVVDGHVFWDGEQFVVFWLQARTRAFP